MVEILAVFVQAEMPQDSAASTFVPLGMTRAGVNASQMAALAGHDLYLQGRHCGRGNLLQCHPPMTMDLTWSPKCQTSVCTNRNLINSDGLTPRRGLQPRHIYATPAVSPSSCCVLAACIPTEATAIIWCLIRRSRIKSQLVELWRSSLLRAALDRLRMLMQLAIATHPARREFYRNQATSATWASQNNSMYRTL